MRPTQWEVEDFLSATGEGLETKMRPSSGTEWRPYDPAVIAADVAVSTGALVLEQDVWWTDIEGTTRLIDDLDDRHRYNIARMLLRKAATLYATKRRNEAVSANWAFVHRAMEKDWCVDPDFDPFDVSADDAESIQQDIAAGKHLAWIRESVLFCRMVRGLNTESLGLRERADRRGC